jgi:hypothetical protein
VAAAAAAAFLAAAEAAAAGDSSHSSGRACGSWFPGCELRAFRMPVRQLICLFSAVLLIVVIIIIKLPN